MELWNTVQEILSDSYSLPYLLTLFAYIIHEMLGLRLVLLSAHLGYFSLALVDNHGAGIFWNSIFIVINSYHIVKILLSRRAIHFEPGIETLYLDIFSSLSRKDFQTFWNLGSEKRLSNQVLLAESSPPRELGLVRTGEILVEKSGTELNRLGPGRFFAEMGYLTRKAASATLRAPESVTVHLWAFTVLDQFFVKNQPIFHCIQGILGRDMAQKISEQNPR